MSGTNDRKERILNPKPGVSGSSSQDLVRLAFELLCHSKEYAEQHDGNVSIYTIAGIPVLFSALRALLIEANTGMFGVGARERLKDLSNLNELRFIDKYYAFNNDVLKDLRLAYEVRNEIAHPSHLPAGTESGVPEYLNELKKRDLLQSGIWLSQLQSHRLFYWVNEIFEQVVSVLLTAHHSDPESEKEHLISWLRYKELKL
ncbi:hypothetical protein [Agaribacterium haliotis]|uniref:hypothetical protein n=1 Tax=Agaribacterium haliotis TaxID=2013869 RepID=UPI000BB54002|nr:hypothetical protein [Agaribacterium haliotis]